MKNRTPKQIAALVCVVLLILLYVFTLVSALLSFPGWQRLFAACLVATIGLPILLWIYIWLYGKVKERHTIASFDLDFSAGREEEAAQENTPAKDNP